MYMASGNGHVEVVRLLLDVHVDVTVQTDLEDGLAGHQPVEI